MIYGILGDIHANLEALNAVIDDANKYGVKCFYSTGELWAITQIHLLA